MHIPNTLNRNTVDGQDIFFTCFNMWIKVGFPQRAVIKSSEEYQKLKKKNQYTSLAQASTNQHNTPSHKHNLHKHTIALMKLPTS